MLLPAVSSMAAHSMDSYYVTGQQLFRPLIRSCDCMVFGSIGSSYSACADKSPPDTSPLHDCHHLLDDQWVLQRGEEDGLGHSEKIYKRAG